MWLCVFDGAGLRVRPEGPPRGWPGLRASTATHLADCGPYGRATRRTASVRRHMRYGGLQHLAEDKAVPPPDGPASRDHGQRGVSYIAGNSTAHQGHRRHVAVPAAVLS